MLLCSVGAAAQDRRRRRRHRHLISFAAAPAGLACGGWSFPRAGGELFHFVSDQLTVDRSDLRTPVFDVEAESRSPRTSPW
jgi:hypothetical protein